MKKIITAMAVLVVCCCFPAMASAQDTETPNSFVFDGTKHDIVTVVHFHSDETLSEEKRADPETLENYNPAYMVAIFNFDPEGLDYEDVPQEGAIIKIIVVPSLTGGSFAPEETLSDGDALWEFSIDFPFEGAGYKAISFRDDHDNMVSGSIYIDRPADSEVEARFDLEMPDGKRLTGNYRGPFKPLSAVE